MSLPDPVRVGDVFEHDTGLRVRVCQIDGPFAVTLDRLPEETEDRPCRHRVRDLLEFYVLEDGS